MLDVEYKRDLYGNYMIIKAAEESELSYGLKMHLNNKIKGLLDVELHVTDDKMEFHYNITSKQVFPCIFEKGQLKHEQLKAIFDGIILSIESGKEYLLRENDFVLNPEYIFIHPSNLEVSLCHYAGYNQDIIGQISGVIEYLMNRVDYTDEQAVVMIYGLYKISNEKNGVLDDLKEFINRKSVILENKPQSTAEKIHEKSLIEKDKVIKEDRKKREEFQIKKKIPRMQEKMSDTHEVLCYSGVTISAGILSGITLIILFISLWKLELLTSITKLFGAILFLVTGEIYLLSKLFSKKNRISKMKTTIEYVDPVQEKEWMAETRTEAKWEEESDETTLLNESNVEKTVLLSNVQPEVFYRLRAENTTQYQDIPIVEFPFFVGKLKAKVNYVIDNTAISRFHAKIECLRDKYFITDLNSTNGTYLGGVRLEPNETKELRTNEKISFANIAYYFEKI